MCILNGNGKRKNIRSFNGYKKRYQIYQIMSYLFTGISEFTLIKSENKNNNFFLLYHQKTAKYFSIQGLINLKML